MSSIDLKDLITLLSANGVTDTVGALATWSASRSLNQTIGPLANVEKQDADPLAQGLGHHYESNAAAAAVIATAQLPLCRSCGYMCL